MAHEAHQFVKLDSAEQIPIKVLLPQSLFYYLKENKKYDSTLRNVIVAFCLAENISHSATMLQTDVTEGGQRGTYRPELIINSEGYWFDHSFTHFNIKIEHNIVAQPQWVSILHLSTIVT